MRILDALIDLGDRRSAALEQAEAFRGVRVLPSESYAAARRLISQADNGIKDLITVVHQCSATKNLRYPSRCVVQIR